MRRLDAGLRSGGVPHHRPCLLVTSLGLSIVPRAHLDQGTTAWI